MNKVGFTASSFDLLHAGHVLMLEDCKKHCDYLIVGLNASPQNKKCVQSLYERWVQINSVKYVDEVVVYDSEADLINILKSRKIDVRFLGEDYRGKPFTGSDLNIPIHYNPRRHDFSTTELKERIRKGAGREVTDETKREI